MNNSDNSRITQQLSDESATAQLAGKLAQQLRPGLVIHLLGDLGAGKTTLVRYLLQALNFQGRVKSPTYTLLEQYSCGNLEIRHFDLYRLNDEEEWEAAGFRDEFNGTNVFLIEWPEKAAHLIPPADIAIQFTILDNGRTLTLQSFTHAGQQCLNPL